MHVYVIKRTTVSTPRSITFTVPITTSSSVLHRDCIDGTPDGGVMVLQAFKLVDPSSVPDLACGIFFFN